MKMYAVGFMIGATTGGTAVALTHAIVWMYKTILGM